MAVFRQGNMLDHLDECDYACITTNAFIKNDGALVMGAGIAKQVRDGYPGIDKSFKNITHMRPYLLCQSDEFPKFIAFQVKRFWGDDADLSLIYNSSRMLKFVANHNSEKTYFLNFPGIGNGRLEREDVVPLIETLPDNVVIWEYS